MKISDYSDFYRNTIKMGGISYKIPLQNDTALRLIMCGSQFSVAINGGICLSYCIYNYIRSLLNIISRYIFMIILL